MPWALDMQIRYILSCVNMDSQRKPDFFNFKTTWLLSSRFQVTQHLFVHDAQGRFSPDKTNWMLSPTEIFVLRKLLKIWPSATPDIWETLMMGRLKNFKIKTFRSELNNGLRCGSLLLKQKDLSLKAFRLLDSLDFASEILSASSPSRPPQSTG